MSKFFQSPAHLLLHPNPHPAILNESRTLFCAQAPSIDYKLGFPSYVLEEKMLSTAQIEAISRACQAHEKFLPSGERMGFLIGQYHKKFISCFQKVDNVKILC